MILIAGSSLFALLLLEPIAQDPAYHLFADGRKFLGVPNFLNVVSNLPFLLAGGVGITLCLNSPVLPQRREWSVVFLGIALVAVGSAYYHWSPSDDTLVWDRLPMTVGFMALLSAILADYIPSRIMQSSLFPLLAVGILSVAYWHLSGDLRLYVWVQFTPLLVIAAILMLYPGRHADRQLLAFALLFYLAAKVCEALDAEIFAALGGGISGHTIKHLHAAAACFCLVAMVSHRRTN